jgi:hypothetical protein
MELAWLLPFDERNVRRSGRGNVGGCLGAPEPKLFDLQIVVPTDGTVLPKRDERKLRYVLVSAAALGQITARPYLLTCDAWTEHTIAGWGFKLAIEVRKRMHSRSSLKIFFAAGRHGWNAKWHV